MHHVAIINFGSQYTRNIKKRLRELRIDAEILAPDAPPLEIGVPCGIILSGSPHSIYGENAPRLSGYLTYLIFDKGIPCLGLCYGMDIIAEATAAKEHYDFDIVKPGKCGEYGKDMLEISHPIGALKGLDRFEQVWMSHGDELILLPPGFQRLNPIREKDKSGDYYPIKALMHNTKPIFGLQFHPEVKETLKGRKIFANFLEICGAEKNWGPEQEFEQIKSKAIAKIGNRHVFAAVSTGVDSGTMSYFLQQIVPKDRLHFLYIRAVGPDDDLEKIKLIGKEFFDIVDARRKVYAAVKGLADPEEKRKAFSKVYKAIIEQWLEQKVAKLGLRREDCIIAQGTLWPDMVESRSEQSGAHTDKIKSHHNIGAFEDLRALGNILEPFTHLFKDEVRAFGRKIDVPERILTQRPWPGPGYLVRFINCDSPPFSIEQDLQNMCAEFGYEARVLPIRGTGVQGDGRTYLYTIALAGPYSKKSLLELATAIPNRFKGKISRVVYVVAPQTEQCITPTHRKDYFRQKTHKILKSASEKILIPNLRLANLYTQISQALIAIAPLSFTGRGYTAIIRAVDTEDFMTCSPHWLPEAFLCQTAQDMMAKLPEIELVLYDLTSKPPGTIEWE